MTSVRKVHVTREELHAEAGHPLDLPLTTVIVAAVVPNPWAGGAHDQDLRPLILEWGPWLGATLADHLVSAFGSADAIQAYGKASMVGIDGELEHAAGLVHTLLFGEQVRARVGGDSTLVFANTRAPAGSQITVPMVHKGELLTRSHYLTAQTSIVDAPRPDEAIVALGGASGGRPFSRIGDREQDRADLACTPG